MSTDDDTVLFLRGTGENTQVISVDTVRWDTWRRWEHGQEPPLAQPCMIHWTGPMSTMHPLRDLRAPVSRSYSDPWQTMLEVGPDPSFQGVHVAAYDWLIVIGRTAEEVEAALGGILFQRSAHWRIPLDNSNHAMSACGLASMTLGQLGPDRARALGLQARQAWETKFNEPSSQDRTAWLVDWLNYFAVVLGLSGKPAWPEVIRLTVSSIEVGLEDPTAVFPNDFESVFTQLTGLVGSFGFEKEYRDLKKVLVAFKKRKASDG